MPGALGGERKGERNPVLRVAVDAVGADRAHALGDRIRPRHARIVRALVPQHHREQHPHAAAMEVRDHAAHALESPGHVLEHVELVAIVDAEVRVRRPDQYRVDATVAALEVVEVAVDRVATGARVVERAIMDHHLRLDERRLRPGERGVGVPRAVMAGADAPLVAPVDDVAQPLGVDRLVAGCGARRGAAGDAEARGTRDQLVAGRVAGILRDRGCGEDREQEGQERGCRAGHGVVSAA